MLTAKQNRIVQIVKQQLGEDAYRHLLECAGVTSSREMNDARLDLFMMEAARLGFKNTSTRSFGPRRGMATPRQVAMIRKLWAEWATENDAHALDRWLESSFGTSALRFLDSAGAGKAIAGLRSMVARKQQTGAV